MSNAITITVDEITITAPASAITVDGKKQSAPTMREVVKVYIEFINTCETWEQIENLANDIFAAFDAGYITRSEYDSLDWRLEERDEQIA